MNKIPRQSKCSKGIISRDIRTQDPLFVVPLDNSSSAYEDNILKVMEKGGVTSSIEEAIMRQYWANRGKRMDASDCIEVEVSGGVQWAIEAKDCQSKSFSEALASKRLIDHLLRAESCRVLV